MSNSSYWSNFHLISISDIVVFLWKKAFKCPNNYGTHFFATSQKMLYICLKIIFCRNWTWRKYCTIFPLRTPTIGPIVVRLIILCCSKILPWHRIRKVYGFNEEFLSYLVLLSSHSSSNRYKIGKPIDWEHFHIHILK